MFIARPWSRIDSNDCLSLRPLLTRRDDGAESAAAEKTVDALERSLTPAFFLSNLLAYPCSIGAVSSLETGHAPSPVTVCLAGIGRFLLTWSDWLGWLNWQGGGQEADHAKSSTKTWQDLLLVNRGGKR